MHIGVTIIRIARFVIIRAELTFDFTEMKGRASNNIDTECENALFFGDKECAAPTVIVFTFPCVLGFYGEPCLEEFDSFFSVAFHGVPVF